MNYTLSGLKNMMHKNGFASYRGEQIFKWLWQKNAKDFSTMTNLAKILRKNLNEKFSIPQIKCKKSISARDGTTKYLFQLKDNHYIESVYLPEARRQTICVSSQVGCPVGCKFCATGLMDFTRNLQVYEIADQIRYIQQNQGKKISNIVFMGMGEPLLNYRNVDKALSIISSPMGLSIGQRHTTISTVGIIDKMHQLLVNKMQLKLAISLNFIDKQKRKEMIPIAKDNPLEEILEIAHEYSRKKNMVTFEYLLIRDINDSPNDAKRLLKLIKGIRSKINLITFNPHPLLSFKPPPKKKINTFHNILLSSYHTVTRRKARGKAISAGCGQLSIITSKPRINNG